MTALKDNDSTQTDEWLSIADGLRLLAILILFMATGPIQDDDYVRALVTIAIAIIITISSFIIERISK